MGCLHCRCYTSRGHLHFCGLMQQGAGGCAALWGREWFQYPWIDRMRGTFIPVMEFLPIVMAAVIWGKGWTGLTIQCNCDNEVCVINSGTSKDLGLMQLLRCLFFVEAKFNFQVVARHTPGVENGLADALSRNRLSAFFSSHPQANSQPVHIPDNLVSGLLSHLLDWTSGSVLFSGSIISPFHSKSLQVR